MKTTLVGITGGIGAGKSALARVFSEAGYPVISADELAREVVAPGSPALVEISALFGSGCLAPDGSLNRGFVRDAISRNEKLRLALEKITHPRIQALSLARSREHFARGSTLVFYEAPLLFEAGGDSKMDAIICVHAPNRVRIARVVARDGRSREEVERLIASQMPQAEKMSRSDHLVLNDGSEEELKARGLELLERLVAGKV